MRLYQLRCKELRNDGLVLEELNEYDNFRELFSLYEFKSILKTKQNRKNKRYRTKQKYIEIMKMYNYLVRSNAAYIVFGTITLDNDALSKKENTYIRKIHSWLKGHFIYSVLNKDYGSKTEREHYHFIGLTMENLVDTGIRSRKGIELYKLENQDYKLGHEPTLEIIDLHENDIDRTINYLLKLNNHSNKVGTRGRVRVLTSWLGKQLRAEI